MELVPVFYESFEKTNVLVCTIHIQYAEGNSGQFILLRGTTSNMPFILLEVQIQAGTIYMDVCMPNSECHAMYT